MGEHKYSVKHFLRQAPNQLLDRYFHERKLLVDLKITELAENDVEPIYEAWSKLTGDIRPKVDEDFQMVDSLADEPGIATILEEAAFHGTRLQDRFAEMPDFYDRALWTFLEHEDWLETAALFRRADDLPKTYWRECDGLDAGHPRDDRVACNGLADTLKQYFRRKDGRGNACLVEVYRRGSRVYYFAYPEDHSRTAMEYDGQENRLQRRTLRPVFQVVFVVDTDNGKFSTFHQGPSPTIRDLQEIFAHEILVTNLPKSRDQKVYDLNPLKHRGFQFKYNPASGIIDVRLRHMKLEIIGGESERILIDVNPDRKKLALYDLLDYILHTGDPNSSSNRIPLSMVNVTKVGIRAYFGPNKRRRRPTKTFYLYLPNGCGLEHDGQDQALRQMLLDSGIEPKAPPALIGASAP